MARTSRRGGVWSLHGYFCDISWDGTTLRVHGRNKAAREFFNEADPSSDLVVSAAEINEVDFVAQGLDGICVGCKSDRAAP